MPGMTVSELQVKVSADTSAAESGLSALGGKLGSIGGGIATAFGGAAIAGVAALGAGLAAATVSAASFEKQISSIKAVSGATGAEIASIQDLALDLGAKTSFSASEAAKGIEELIKAGVSIGDVMGGAASASLSLAAAGAISVGDAAEIAANAMNQFGLKGADLAHVSDLIAGAANASAIDVNDFKFSLAAVGAVANTVGATFDDTATAIALLGQAGIKGSDAGTSLKTMLMSLQPESKKQIALFRELGIVTANGSNKFFDQEGKLRGLGEVAQILTESLEGMTEQQKLSTLETIFGSDAIRAAAVFAKQGGDGFNNMAEAMAKVTAEAVASERLNNLAGSVEQLTGSLETAGIQIGLQFTPHLRGLVDSVTSFVNDVTPALVDFAGAMSEGMTDAGAAVTDLAGRVASLLGIEVADYESNWVALWDGIKLAAYDAKAAISTAVNDLLGTVAKIGSALTGAELDPLKTSAENAATQVQTLNDQLSKIDVSGKFATSVDNLGRAWGAANELGKPFGDTLMLVGRGWAFHNEQVGPAASLIGGIADTFNDVVRGATLGMEAIRSWVGVIGFAGTATVESYKMIGAAARGDMAAAREHEAAATTSWENVGKTINKFNADVTLSAIANGKERGAISQQEYDKLFAVADEGQRKILDQYISGQAERTGVITRGVAEDVAAFAKLQPDAEQITRTTHESINAILGQGMAEGAAIAESGGAQIATGIETGMTASEAVAQTGMAGVVGAVEGAVPAATAAGDSLGQGVSSGIEAAAPQMVAAAESGASGAVAAVEGQSGAASGAGQSIGQALGSGLEGGIMAYVGRVAAAAANLVRSAIGAANAEGEIHSPSERTKKTGRSLAEGVAVGIAELAPAVQAEMRALIDAAASYAPVAGEIARVEKELASLREKGQTDALFRAKEMVTIDSEALRLKQLLVTAERDLLPTRQELARVSREIETAERGSLQARQDAIRFEGSRALNNIEMNKLEKERIPLRQQQLELERKLIGLDSDSKKAKSIQKDLDKLREKDSLIANSIDQARLNTRAQELDIASSKEAATVATTGARLRREALGDQVRDQETANQATKDAIDTLGAEQAVYQAAGAIIANILGNEIAERQRLLAVFKAEGAPVAERIAAGLAYVDQLKREGIINDDLAGKIKEYVEKTGKAATSTASLGSAAATAAPQIDTAAQKAAEMAKQAQSIATATGDAKRGFIDLGQTIGKLPSLSNLPDAIFKPDHRASGGPVSAGMPYVVGERRPELFVPDRSGTILPSVPGGRGGGDTYIVNLNANGFIFERELPELVGKALGQQLRRGGRIG